MSEIQVSDKKFKPFISEEQIRQRVKEIAAQIDSDMKDKNPLILIILNGTFIFAADLCREITIAHEISFMKLSSYEGTSSTGHIKQTLGIGAELKNRHVIIMEDIVDTGRTMKYILEQIKTQSPASVQVCSLLHKPTKTQFPTDIKYLGFTIPDNFVVGYGLDYNQQGRNLKALYTITK